MDTTYPWGVNISYDSEGMTNWAASTRKSGFSIRLIKEFTVGIGGMNKNENFSIYPNPAHDRIIVVGENMANVTMAVYNLVGELLMQQELQDGKNMIDVRSLTTGMYIIKLSGKDWSARRRLNKE